MQVPNVTLRHFLEALGFGQLTYDGDSIAFQVSDATLLDQSIASLISAQQAEVDSAPPIYASESVTDELAHAVAVLEETRHNPSIAMLDDIVDSAIDSGKALVEILRGET